MDKYTLKVFCCRIDRVLLPLLVGLLWLYGFVLRLLQGRITWAEWSGDLRERMSRNFKFDYPGRDISQLQAQLSCRIELYLFRLVLTSCMKSFFSVLDFHCKGFTSLCHFKFNSVLLLSPQCLFDVVYCQKIHLQVDLNVPNYFHKLQVVSLACDPWFQVVLFVAFQYL